MALTVAIVLSLLVQLPPVAASRRVPVKPVHIVVVPLMLPADGAGLTVITTPVLAVPQLLVTEYEILAVPADTPVTAPVAAVVATEVLLLDHTPPPVPSARVVTAPAHTDPAPLMLPAVGKGLTVTVAVVLAEPQLTVVVA